VSTFLGAYLLIAVPIVVLIGLGGVTFLVPLVAGIAAGGYAWAHAGDDSNSRLAPVFVGAVLFGGIGLAAGFLGPMVLAPGANQGPLLGIFITGPAGILVGAGAGLVYGRRRSGRARR
jgi:hypothetical protein